MKTISTSSLIVFGALLLLGATPASRLAAAMQPIANTVVNGVVGEGDWGYFWNDSQQNVIRAQGGSILQVGSTYYWYGYDFDDFTSPQTPVYYTSSDLSHWTFGGLISFTGLPDLSATPPNSPNNYHNRPRVIYNSTTSQYVMVVEGPPVSGRPTICFFSATSPGGPFALQNTERVMNPAGDTDPSGLTTCGPGDHNIFVDTDGTGYLVCACDDGGTANGSVRIVQLASDYLSQSAVASTLAYASPSDLREAPCLFKRGSCYFYLFTSRTNGWFGSRTEYATATALNGSWSTGTPTSPTWSTVNTSPAWGDSFATQNNMVICLNGSGGVTTNVASLSATTYIYAGDRWTHRQGYGSGRADWDVLSFDSSTPAVPTINHSDLFYLDVAAGTTSTTTYAGPPCVPSNVTAFNRTSSIWLNWTATPGAQTYTMRRATSVSGPYTVLGTGATALSWNDTSITLGTTYYYLVSAVNTAGESLVSSNPQVRVNNSSFGQVAAPAGVTAAITSAGASGQIQVSWTAVTGATNYNVLRSTISGGPYTAMSPLMITTTSYTDKAATPGITYYYVVAATNVDSGTNLTSGWSANSSEASCAAPSGRQSPLTAAVISGSTDVAVSWQRDSTSLTFHIYRSTDNATWGSSIATVDTTSYVDTPGTGTFYYKVLGVINGVESGDNPSHPNVTVP